MSEFEPKTQVRVNNWRKDHRDSLLKWAGELNEQCNIWNIEVVKHLVVLNAAGFAGVATLIAGNRPPGPSWIGALALAGYGSGVAAAILNLYLVASGTERDLQELRERIGRTFDPECREVELTSHLTRGNRLASAGVAIGWVSAALGILCTIGIGWSLAAVHV